MKDLCVFGVATYERVSGHTVDAGFPRARQIGTHASLSDIVSRHVDIGIIDATVLGRQDEGSSLDATGSFRMFKAVLSTSLVAVMAFAIAPGCSKDLGLDSTRFSCQTDDDCPGKVCDPLAKVCKAPGEDVSVLNLDATVTDTQQDTPIDVAVDGTPDIAADVIADLPPDVPTGPPPTCVEYCDVVIAACGSSNDNPVIGQYVSVEQCLSVCQSSFFDGAGVDIRGNKGATTGNTLACRLSHAVAAQGKTTDSATVKYAAAVANCEAAGYTGGNTCGSWCDTYCHLNTAHCSTNYPDEPTCQTACAGLSVEGTPKDIDDDTLHCRVYHAITAGLNKPGSADTHCGHVAVEPSDGTCSVPTADPNCVDYCLAMNTHCTGDYFAQYGGDKAACESTCGNLAKFKPGSVLEKDTNTIGCRLYHAKAAQHDPIFHCPAATTESNGTCGTWCDNYCDLASSGCTGANALFTNDEACQTACAEFPEDGAPGDGIGDTVQCRSYHLLIAGADEGAATEHCPHGSVESDIDHCTGAFPEPTCDELCTILDATCTAGDQLFPNNTACLNYCYTQAVLDPGSFQDTHLNTVGCRITAAKNASEDPETWCPVAGTSGGGQCGSLCKNYCDLALNVCVDDDALYVNEDECFFACAGFTDGELGDTKGNTTHCRIYHLLAAASNPPTSVTDHCPHAGAIPTSQCVESQR